MPNTFKMKQRKYYEGTLVKLQPSNGSNTNTFADGVLRLCSISSSKEMDEYVVLQSQMYQEIFKGKKIDADDDHKRLSVVKICCGGKTIHRAYRSEPAKGFNKGHVALSTNSIYLLSQGKELPPGTKVCLSKGSKWIFYWDNPNAAVRMSFRIGTIGIVVSLIGINLTNIFDGISCLIHHIICLLQCGGCY